MRIQREADSEDTVINISSLLDVIFILVIFLIATMTFEKRQRSEDVNLPPTSDSTSLTQEASQTLVINCLKSGKYVVLGEPQTLDKMQAIVKQRVGANAEQEVLIRGDKEALHGYVAAALERCMIAGVDKAKIAYDVRTPKFEE